MAGCQKGVPYEYIHQADMDTKELSKKSRHRQTICMVNKERETEGRDKYERVYTTFQSTSSCNIQVVNIMKQCSYYNVMK